MRIGILGGSYNPIHVGHLRLAVETLERLRLTRLDMAPCSVPPHKEAQGLLPFDLRAKSISLALGLEGEGPPEPGLQLNTLEQERQGPSYTIDTLSAYHCHEPGCRLYFILGAGDLLTLPEWKQGLELPEATNLVVVPRQENDLDAVADFVREYWPRAKHHATPEMHEATAMWRFPNANGLFYLPLPRLDISSTMIRYIWRKGRSLRGLMPAPVIRLLEENRELVDRVWRTEAAKTKDIIVDI